MGLLEGNFRGLQHMGIPVTNLEKSKAFYKELGFTPVMSAPFDNDNGTGQCCMVKCMDAIIELYQLPETELHDIEKRGDGRIDHIAFDVNDISLAYTELMRAGFTIESKPASLDFWDNGCQYFTVIGPDGERLEFNQINKE
jgi:catechol 2,3-dioxygenase-like lactoylglutathione lyase family enzyme